jgi:hypothetical protein
MNRMTRRLVVTLVVALAVSACGRTTPAEAEATVCDARAQLQESVDALRAMTLATTPIATYRDAVTQVGDDLSTLAEYRQELNDTNADELFTAIDDLKDAIYHLPEGVPATEAMDSLQPERQAVANAFNALTDELNCPE